MRRGKPLLVSLRTHTLRRPIAHNLERRMTGPEGHTWESAWIKIVQAPLDRGPKRIDQLFLRLWLNH